MKKLFTILTVVAISTTMTFAQQGTVILGATTELSSTPWSQVVLEPSIGYFLSDKIAVGLGFGLGTQSLESDIGGNATETTSSSNFEIGPWMRFYLNEMFFLNAGVEIGSGSTSTEFSGPGTGSMTAPEISGSTFGMDIGCGASILWGDHIAFEPTFGLNIGSGSQDETLGNTTTTTNLPSTMNLGFGIGVCIMLGN